MIPEAAWTAPNQTPLLGCWMINRKFWDRSLQAIQVAFALHLQIAGSFSYPDHYQHDSWRPALLVQNVLLFSWDSVFPLQKWRAWGPHFVNCLTFSLIWDKSSSSTYTTQPLPATKFRNSGNSEGAGTQCLTMTPSATE